MLASANLRPRGRTARTLRTLACILGGAAFGACAPVARPEQAPSPATGRVVVHNYGWDRVTLYMASRGLTWRLGDLEGFSDGTFPVPQGVAADVGDAYFVAWPFAGRSFRSEPFAFRMGTTAVWTIQAQPTMSYVMLR